MGLKEEFDVNDLNLRKQETQKGVVILSYQQYKRSWN